MEDTPFGLHLLCFSRRGGNKVLIGPSEEGGQVGRVKESGESYRAGGNDRSVCSPCWDITHPLRDWWKLSTGMSLCIPSHTNLPSQIDDKILILFYQDASAQEKNLHRIVASLPPHCCGLSHGKRRATVSAAGGCGEGLWQGWERLWLESQRTAPGTWMQHKHPKHFQWILFRLIKNTNQACMYILYI